MEGGSMTLHAILPTRNEAHGFYGTITICPLRDRRSDEVWTLASKLIAIAMHAGSEDEMTGIRDFLDSRMGRHFADDVVGALQNSALESETAISSAICRWKGWCISSRIAREEGIPAGLPYLTGWVQHFAVTAAMADAG
jgi:hypothetical protein